MAKLSANGHEVARIIVELPDRDDHPFHCRAAHFSFRSNGWVLRKDTSYRDDDTRHATGWSRYGRVSSGYTIDSAADALADAWGLKVGIYRVHDSRDTRPRTVGAT